jgi:Cdc6-like AAA superfamily ATPase
MGLPFLFSCESLLLLPARPQIFHGRDSELRDIAECLAKGTARIAILGPGRVGKTSLALAAMHHAEVSTAYRQLHFIPCHSAPTCNDLAFSIASHLALEKAPNLSKVIVDHLSYHPLPVLLVLDNFETTWEKNDSRREVEEFLSLLAEVPKLSLMVWSYYL